MGIRTVWAVGITAMVLTDVSQASFYIDGVATTAPGTFSWVSDMSGWGGVDAAAGSGSNTNSAMLDGNANAYDAGSAAIAVGSWLAGLQIDNPVFGVIDLGQSYFVESLQLLQGAGNGWWGNLGATVRVSNTSSDWASATDVGTLAIGGLWSSPPGSAASASFEVNAPVRYVLLSVGYSQGNLKLDEMNIYTTVPEPITLAMLAAGGLAMLRKRM